jgi:aminoglycoside phosphotransferase family enzyme/predicted kinase
MDQAAIVDWLRSGHVWGQAPKVVETHAAYVFLVGERAFKLKKAVDLGYLDFSTAEKRRRALTRELELNRRTAPHLYLRVLPITEHAGAFALAGEGRAVDFLLEMRRFADDALLSDLADRGRLEVATVERLAHHIAVFHASEKPLADYDWPRAAARIADENLRDLEHQRENFDAAKLAAHAAARGRVHDSARAALSRQSATVRHCHGDLHLRNAFLDEGSPILFDCIEFDDFYATIPPLYDLAFLIMDLWARGLREHANRALNAWAMDQAPAAWRATFADLGALPAYLTWRAEIRAKTEALRPGGAESARRYLALSTEFAAPSAPMLVAVGGLSGTGKSTLARSLAPSLGRAPGAVHLRTDEIRKRIAGVALDARLDATAYTAARNAQVYATMLGLAQAALGAGQAVIADAVFAREDERAAVEAIAAELSLPFVGLWLDAPAATLQARLGRRRDDVSDADAAVLRKQLTYDLGHINWHRLDADQTTEALVNSARGLLPH